MNKFERKFLESLNLVEPYLRLFGFVSPLFHKREKTSIVMILKWSLSSLANMSHGFEIRLQYLEANL